jgi:UDP-3-O-acyl-N-acetylglucosamine deacetylase
VAIHNRLRYADEPARHKLLDLIGDLSLLGHDVRGRLVAYRSGHALNVELVRALARQLPAACAGHRVAA